MDRICSKRSTPVAMAAIFVVSESGDSLSPKYAPPTTAPATMPESAPTELPIPINTTPTVATLPHEVPVSVEKTAAIRNAVAYRTLGSMSCIPQLTSMGIVPLSIQAATRGPIKSNINIAGSAFAKRCTIACWIIDQEKPSQRSCAMAKLALARKTISNGIAEMSKTSGRSTRPQTTNPASTAAGSSAVDGGMG